VNQNGIDAYRTNQVLGASPGQLVLMLYDHVIRCIANRDMRGASKGLVELMGSLDLDYQEVSGRLFSLYEYCLDLVKKSEYEQASKILTEMRQLWATAIGRMAGHEEQVTGDKERIGVRS
jgi:flagellin-specific chaperone FliS